MKITAIPHNQINRSSQTDQSSSQEDPRLNDLIQALVALGEKQKDAEKIATEVIKKSQPNDSIEDLVKKALRKPSSNSGNSNKQSEKPTGLENVDFSNKDHVQKVFENAGKIREDFAGKFDPNNKEHIEKSYLLGSIAGTKIFWDEVVSPSTFGTKGKFLVHDAGGGMAAAAAEMRENMQDGIGQLAQVKNGLTFLSLMQFSTWCSILICIAEGEVYNQIPNAIENESEAYITRLNTAFPFWVKVGKLARLQNLLRKGNEQTQDASKTYENAVLYGKQRFNAEIAANQNVYQIEDMSSGLEKASTVMQSKASEILALAQTNGTSSKNLMTFVSTATLLFCVMYSNTKSVPAKRLISFCSNNIKSMNIDMPNWYAIPELNNLNSLLHDKISPNATPSEVESSWVAGIGNGVGVFNTQWINNSNISFANDAKGSVAIAKKVLDDISDFVSQYLAVNNTNYNSKNLTNFAQDALVVLALSYSKASGQNGYDLKTQINGLLDNMDKLWSQWESQPFFNEISRVRSAAGLSKLNPERSEQIWHKVNEKVFPLIRSAISGIEDNEVKQKLNGLLSNPHTLTSPRDVGQVIGSKHMTAEKSYMANKAIQELQKLKGANIDSLADFLIRRIAGWASSVHDYEKIIPYDVAESAKKKFRAPSGGSSNQGTQSPASQETPNKQRWEPETSIYASSKFIGAISFAMYQLFQSANERSSFIGYD